MVNRHPTYNWRVIDVVTAAVLGITCGLIFMLWNYTGALFLGTMDILLPGAVGLLIGPWFIGGTIGGVVIRKPGAAFLVEFLAAAFEMTTGAHWGIDGVYSGIAQGLGAEIFFAIFMYTRYTILVAALSGVGAGIGEFFHTGVSHGIFAQTTAYQVVYFITICISGAILSGVAGHLLVQALARTGALDRFAVGREARQRI